MSEYGQVIPFSNENVNCAMCGSSSVESRHESQSFEYGSGDSMVFLEAIIPVHHCVDCLFEFTTVAADLVRHDAVCRHLNIQTPKEVQAVRVGRDMSKVDFSRHTGIGEASLTRWEHGALLQSRAMDNFLYLLGIPGNLEALQDRHFVCEKPSLGEGVFRCLELTDDLFERKQRFDL